jgi:putative flippase GtrA
MPDDAASTVSEQRLPATQNRRLSFTHARDRVRQRHNWAQLVRFCAVGAVGYGINLAVFAPAVAVLGLHHLAAATLAFAAGREAWLRSPES